MAVEFPINPTINQVYIPSPGKTFVWTGDAWEPYVVPGVNLVTYIPKFSQAVNVGVSVNFDYFQFQIPTSGNRSLQIRTTDGSTRTIAGSAGYNNGITFGDCFNLTIGPTNWVYLVNWTFGTQGDTAWYYFYNEATFETYRATFQIAAGYINNLIVIEKLWQ